MIDAMSFSPTPHILSNLNGIIIMSEISNQAYQHNVNRLIELDQKRFAHVLAANSRYVNQWVVLESVFNMLVDNNVQLH